MEIKVREMAMNSYTVFASMLLIGYVISTPLSTIDETGKKKKTTSRYWKLRRRGFLFVITHFHFTSFFLSFFLFFF